MPLGQKTAPAPGAIFPSVFQYAAQRRFLSHLSGAVVLNKLFHRTQTHSLDCLAAGDGHQSGRLAHTVTGGQLRVLLRQHLLVRQASLLEQPDVDGGLIGGASLKPADFVAIVNAANQE